MQCVIMAAGQGKRLRPLTYHVPKPMLRLAGKNLIEHKLDQLPDEINELIFVVGYLAEQIMYYFGNQYKGRKIIYVRQKKLLGSGHTLHLCKAYLKERFLVMNGDDLYGSEDIKNCLQYQQSMLAQGITGKFIGGRIKLKADGTFDQIIEGAHNRKESLANAGLYVLTDKFFSYKLVPIKDGKEFGLPQTIVQMARDYPVNIVKAKFWLPINSIGEFKRAENLLK